MCRSSWRASPESQTTIEVVVIKSSLLPDRQILHAAMALSVRAPSIRNCQPWDWRLGEDTIDLYVDPSRGSVSPELDVRDLVISCGASLNHCQVAFAALGWQAEVRRLPSRDEPNHLATIQFHRYAPGEVDTELSAAIPRRRSDRGNFSSWRVPQSAITMMGARAARAGVMLRRFDEIISLKQQVEESNWRSESERLTGSEGAPSSAMPDRQPIEDNAYLVALGTVADDRASHLRVGEATGLVLLTATAAGLASCAITKPLEIPDICAELREDAFGSCGFPQMLVRIGWPPPDAGPSPSTPRHPLNEVVRRQDGSSFHHG